LIHQQFQRKQSLFNRHSYILHVFFSFKLIPKTFIPYSGNILFSSKNVAGLEKIKTSEGLHADDMTQLFCH